jgi:hypothetical protein
MVRFMDELHGSIGERVRVTDLTVGLVHEGSVEALHEDAEKVDVRYDDGTLVRVGIGFVSFVKGEDEDDA